MADARTTLKAAALQTLRTRGIAGTSARAIADTAGLSQGLIFYHYGSVNGLLQAAAIEITEQRALTYRHRLAMVTSLSELAVLARQLHDEERQLGNVAVMAQLLAGAHTHPELAPVARANYDLLATEVRDALHRLLSDTALASALSSDHLAQAVSAAFIGIELLPTTDDVDTGQELFDTLGEVARLVDSVLDLGPTATAALRRRISRGQRRR